MGFPTSSPTSARFLIPAFVGLIFSLIPASSSSANQWYDYGGHFYTLTENYGNWAEAEAEAVSLGGHLVTINDASENAWLTSTFRDNFDRSFPGDPNQNILWIGYFRDNTGWKWISGESVTYVNFSPPWPIGGTHAYLLLEYHRWANQWGDNPLHDTNFNYQPKGIVEVSSSNLTAAGFLNGRMSILFD